MKLKAAITIADSLDDKAPEKEDVQHKEALTTEHDDTIAKSEDDYQMVDAQDEDEAV